MKKIFFEIGLVILSALLYFLVPQVRIPVIIAFALLAIWILPVQLFLSIKFQTWKDEIGGRFHKLTPDERLLQIRTTFCGLDSIEANKLHYFYIQISVFHYLIMLLFSLSFVLVGFELLGLGAHYHDTKTIAISLFGAISVFIFGFIIINTVFPASSKKNLDYTLHIFSSKNWRKYVFGQSNSVVENEFIDGIKQNSFYSFWLIGKTIEERKVTFQQFTEDLNKHSKNGNLFEFDDYGKIKLIVKVHGGAANRTLIGFLKYCIEYRKVLSKDILEHDKRVLLKDIFIIEDSSEKMISLEKKRYDKAQEEYVEIYK